MYQKQARHPIARMPRVLWPTPFGTSAICQLSKAGVKLTDMHRCRLALRGLLLLTPVGNQLAATQNWECPIRLGTQRYLILEDTRRRVPSPTSVQVHPRPPQQSFLNAFGDIS